MIYCGPGDTLIDHPDHLEHFKGGSNTTQHQPKMKEEEKSERQSTGWKE